MNLQQKTFCYEYLKDFNAVRSYKAAKYSSRGAEHNAYKLLKHPEVEALIAEELSKLWNLSKEQWLQGLMDLKKLAPKYSDKIRCMELYGKAMSYLGADTNVTNYNIMTEAMTKLNNRIPSSPTVLNDNKT